MAQKRIWNWYNVLLMIILVAVVILIILQNTVITGNATKVLSSITGYASEHTTTSNVSISYYVSMALCSNLTQGISFGDVQTLPETDINATHNYDETYTSNETLYCVNVSTNSNSPVDFCIKADGPLNTSNGDEIGIGNETWANSTTTDLANPSLSDQTSLTTGYVKAGYAIPEGSLNYYRFWLDVPAGQASGDYNNTVYFEGVTQTLGC